MGSLNNINFDKETIYTAFTYLGEILDKKDIQCRICLYGGSALIFMYDLRDVSKDIDYRVIPFNRINLDNLRSLERIVQMAIFDVGEMLHFDVGWMNDAVKIFASENEDYSSEMNFGNGALKVLTPSPECILAMKCLCLRNDEDTKDKEDITKLLDILNINDIDSIINIVTEYFPNKSIPKENLLTLEDVLVGSHAAICPK